LDQRLALLTSGHRGGRHRTLRDAIGWSYDLCTPAERVMWARLSVFAGPFTMSAAEEVCAAGLDDDMVMPTVIRLVDKSVLARIDPPGDGGGQPTQYLMLDTIREFGAERLAECGTDCRMAGDTPDRFAARYLAMARYFRDHFLDDDQLARLRELRREHANVRAALEYALSDQSRAADSDELAAAAQGLALAAELGDPALAALGYLVRTAALCVAGRLQAAAEAGDEARRRFTTLGDQLGLTSLDIQLTYLALLNEDIDAALGHVERGLRQLGGSRERWLHANLYLLASLTLYLAGRDIE